nr:PREDICTED: proline-, glutamic acid- and leucine-rich protein 1 [Bemisia tabaci]
MKMSHRIALLVFLIQVFAGGTDLSHVLDASDPALGPGGIRGSNDSDQGGNLPDRGRKFMFNDTELWTKFSLVVRPDQSPGASLTTEKNGLIYTTNRSLGVPTPTPLASKWTKVHVTLPPRKSTPPSLATTATSMTWTTRPTTTTTMMTFATQKPATTLSTLAASVTNRSVLLPETRRKPEKKDRQDDIFYDDEDEDEYEDEDEEEEDEEEEELEEAEFVEVEKVDYENYSEEPPTILKKKKKRKRKRGKKNSLKLKDFKKLKKFMLPLLLAYKLKFFTLVPLLLGGLVLIVGTTGFAGFFFALFAVGLGLKHH